MGLVSEMVAFGARCWRFMGVKFDALKGWGDN